MITEHNTRSPEENNIRSWVQSEGPQSWNFTKPANSNPVQLMLVFSQIIDTDSVNQRPPVVLATILKEPDVKRSADKIRIT